MFTHRNLKYSILTILSLLLLNYLLSFLSIFMSSFLIFQGMSRNTKSLRNGRSVLDKLECETVLMEERLVTLKRQLEADRITREIKNKDRECNSFWNSGQVGFVSTHAKQLVKDMKSTQPMKHRRFKMLTENSLVDSNNIPCPPHVSCEKTCPAQSSHSISHESSNLATESCEKYVTSQIPNSLLDGCYDESANAESFKEVLNEWRNSGTGSQTGTMNTSTDKPVNRKILELPSFKTNSTLTYFDRLMLSRYQAGTNTSSHEEKPARNVDTLKPSISEYNIFYSSGNLSLEPEQEPKLEMTEVLDSDAVEARGDNNMHLKITTQTDLSSFFLLGTEETNEILSESTSQILDYHAGKLISGGKIAWRQDDAINSTNTDSDSECSLVDYEDNLETNFSGDEEILTLERLSDELKCGTESGSNLWTELMCHRPPSTSDFN